MSTPLNAAVSSVRLPSGVGGLEHEDAAAWVVALVVDDAIGAARDVLLT